ncbi:MAG: NAD(P)-binding protein [Vicinamibacterales bacterium]
MSPRQKVAILGGGAGSMTAAYYLSNTPELRERFDVTVYQIGWRLGGKGANGRRAEAGARIEEHGLHVWGGFYHNAFKTMRACYADLNRPAGAPLATVDDAFIAAPEVFWEEQIDGAWRHWPVKVPTAPGLPGEGGELPTVHQYIQLMISFLHDWMSSFPHDVVLAALHNTQEPLLARLRAIATGAEHLVADIVDGSGLSALRAARELSRHAALTNDTQHYDAILEYLELFWQWLTSTLMREISLHDEARRAFIVADLGLALVKGLLRDRIHERGFAVIDDQDFVGWLQSHGATALALTAAPLRGFYDYFFAYAQGDPAQPRMSASMGLYHLLRLVFTYKCSLFFKMTSGMGDTVFGPLYETCRRNGVRVQFFHEAVELVPDPSSPRIAAIRLRRQVNTRGEYQPLVDVKGLPSWPSEPLFEQIQEGDELRRSRCDLEDPWSGWTGGTEIELSDGRDFDIVVLGIPVGAHRMICPKLIERSAEWRAMVDNLQTIQTQAMQLWWNKPTSALGDTGELATGTGYGQPLESWSDMSHVLVREAWPEAIAPPQSVVYFCGPMMTPERVPDGPDPGFGERQRMAARAIALKWCEDFLPHLYPKAMLGQQIDWNALVVANGSEGPARFDAQYHRANYTPSERYVLDLPGTSRQRLDADASGFDNLLLAGDWVFTGLGGAVESAVIGGMQAAQALSGVPLGIIGALPNPWSRLPKFRAR